MKNKLKYVSAGLVIAVILSIFYATRPIREATTTPVKVDVYFLLIGKFGNFVAYVPGQSVRVNVKIEPSVTKPYIEVTKMSNKPKVWETNAEEFIVWGLGGTLYVRDIQQIKDLLLVK